MEKCKFGCEEDLNERGVVPTATYVADTRGMWDDERHNVDVMERSVYGVQEWLDGGMKK